MPREKFTTVIDGDRYEMTLLGATQGIRLFHRLFRMFGPAFGRVMDSVGEGNDLLSVDLSSNAAVAGLQTIATSVSEADLDHLVDTLKKQTQVGPDGADKLMPLAGVFELHFSGRLGSMFKWLGWGLKVQYGNFLDAFASTMPPSGGEGSPAANSQSQ